MSSYYFNEEHEMFRKSLKDFLNKEVTPNIDQWEKDQRIPRDVWKKMGDMGFLGLNFPKEHGGMGLDDFFYDVVFLEETCKVFSGGFSITQSVVQYMSGPYIYKYGSDRLKSKYLPGLISGDLISCIGITEPGAGSDVQNIQTTAKREGDHYIVNGSKTFITNGIYGDILVAVVKTDPNAGPGGVSLLIIDLDAEGVSKNKLRKLGWHASDTAELAFDDVKVPVENLVGEEGQGFYYLMGGLQLERLAAGIMGYAGCETSMEYTLQYMSEREAFGRTINRFQVLRHRIAQLASEIEATKQFVLYCCKMNNDGAYAVKECSMAKLLATELSDKAAYQLLQFFGGNGFMEDFKAARFFRDSRVGTIGGGSSEIMREIIAKMVIDDIDYKKAEIPSASDNGESISNHQNENKMESILAMLQAKAASHSAIENTLKFDFGDEHLYVDGTGGANTVSAEDKDADCTISVEKEDLKALISGELDPMSAVMTGKVRIAGDMGVAMKLQALFS